MKKSTDMTHEELAAYIDQSVLKPEFSEAEIRKYIQEGIDYKCKTVCIHSASLPIARELCRDTLTGICVVCDFPFGTSSTKSKVAQAALICQEGDIADLDVVANYGWIRSGRWDAFAADITAVATITHQYGTQLKLILETDALTLAEIARATDIACNAGVDFIKTSTGFFNGSSAGATTEVVQVIMDAAQGRCKVKGSGGIRTREHFLALIDMGIDRMGIGYRSTPQVLGLQA